MKAFLVEHGAHLIVMGGPIVLMAGMFALLQLDAHARLRPARSQLGALLVLAWVGSATIHLMVIREHFAEATVLGVFFLALAVVQLAYALLISVAATRPLLLLGVLANLGMIALWAYTRTVAVPFGLGPREAVGVADVTAGAFEAAAVLLGLLVLRAPREGVAPPSGLEPETLRLTVECSAN